VTASTSSRIPANAPKPQDRKSRQTPAQKAAAKARQAEATTGFVTVEVLGMTLRVPIGDNVPLAALIAFEKEDELGGTELMIGPEQWKAFLEKNPTIGDFNEVGRQLEELTGN
jgi:hypothetical protein